MSEYMSLHFTAAGPAGTWEADQEVAHEGEITPVGGRHPIAVSLRSDPDKSNVLGQGWIKVPLYLKAIPDHEVFSIRVELVGADKARWRISKADLGDDRATWLAAADCIEFDESEIFGNASEDWCHFWVAAFSDEEEAPKVNTTVLVHSSGIAQVED